MTSDPTRGAVTVLEKHDWKKDVREFVADALERNLPFKVEGFGDHAHIEYTSGVHP